MTRQIVRPLPIGYADASAFLVSVVVIAVKESLDESHVATPAAVGTVRRAVAEYAACHGIAGPKLDAVRLAVSEAATNVVVHAYRGSEVGELHVNARVAGGDLWVLIADDGCGPNTPAVRPGLGLGLALIADACDEFTLVERASGGTEAQMCFRIEWPGQRSRNRP